MICFGVDIGGTTVKLGMFNEAGELLEKWEIPTRKENYSGMAIVCCVTLNVAFPSLENTMPCDFRSV